MKETFIRSYQKDKKTFSYFKNGTYYSDEECKEPENFSDEFDWNNTGQLTGLLDKNGKRIFEGDIVRILYTDWPSKSEYDKRTLDEYLNDMAVIGTITFEGDRYCVSIKSKVYDDEFSYHPIFPGKYGFIEVIENIHEA